MSSRRGALFREDSHLRGPCGQKTLDYVNARCAENGTKSTFEPVEPDADQQFVYDKVFDLCKLEPTVACHPDPGQRKLAKEPS